ncbi:MAG: hypothetical protein NTX82_01390 [Candidatus Parcubacteria bacterium]|nr:hypothetical protein [Candidatus Parcubacteria bacterium]
MLYLKTIGTDFEVFCGAAYLSIPIFIFIHIVMNMTEQDYIKKTLQAIWWLLLSLVLGNLAYLFFMAKVMPAYEGYGFTPFIWFLSLVIITFICLRPFMWLSDKLGWNSGGGGDISQNRIDDDH